MPTLFQTVRNKKGLHARAAAKFVKTAGAFNADIRVKKSGALGEDAAEVGGTSILGLMMLGAETGATLEITAEGAQAEEALTALKELLETKFGED